jgi:lipopolysaccharide export system protein LptA
MVSNSKTGLTRYEGGSASKRVRLWQKEDLIFARTLVLEREARRMTAEGDVTTLLVESAQNGAVGARRPISISAERMVYTEQDRRANYEGRVLLRRQESTTRAAALDAYLLPAEEVKPGQSRLERAVARGSVEIQELAAGRLRRAAAEVAEYSSSDEKMILSGGEPYLFDEQRGYTRGRQLTYYIRDDRIFVHGDAAARTLTEHRVAKRR